MTAVGPVKNRRANGVKCGDAEVCGDWELAGELDGGNFWGKFRPPPGEPVTLCERILAAKDSGRNRKCRLDRTISVVLQDHFSSLLCPILPAFFSLVIPLLPGLLCR